MDAALRATAVAAAIVVVVLLCFIPSSTNDFWLHAAIGRIIWTGGEIPRTALFPFTEAAAAAFHAQEWLASVAFYLLHEGLGGDRLIFVNGALGFILFGLAWRLSYRVSASFNASLLVAVAALVAANYRHDLRPELFALIFALGVLSLLVEFRAGGKWRYLMGCAPLALLWANSHGSFPAALALAASFGAGAALEARGNRLRAALPYLGCGALMALAMLVNPFGAEVFRFAWNVENAAQHIDEWMPTLSGAFVGSRGFWAFVIFCAAGAALLAFGWRHVPAAGWLVLLAFGGLALHTQRYIALFAFVSIYPLSAAAGAAARKLDASRVARGAALALLAAGAALLVRHGNLYGGYAYFVESRNFSGALIDYIEARKFEGNVLNSHALGAELVYRFYPRLRPAIDSRIDVYGKEYFEYLQSVQKDPQMLKQFIERYRVRYILLLWPEFEQGPRGMPHLQDEGWRIVFADHKMVMLERQ
jgi:hypothetical protein